MQCGGPAPRRQSTHLAFLIHAAHVPAQHSAVPCSWRLEHVTTAHSCPPPRKALSSQAPSTQQPGHQAQSGEGHSAIRGRARESTQDSGLPRACSLGFHCSQVLVANRSRAPHTAPAEPMCIYRALINTLVTVTPAQQLRFPGALGSRPLALALNAGFGLFKARPGSVLCPAPGTVGLGPPGGTATMYLAPSSPRSRPRWLSEQKPNSLAPEAAAHPSPALQKGCRGAAGVCARVLSPAL